MKSDYEIFRQQLITEEREVYSNGADLTQGELLYGKCASFCKRFKQRFPDLRIAKGWCCGREHHWLVTPEGEIYDPTVQQFLLRNITSDSYQEVNEETDQVFAGRCMNCGSEIYGLMKEGRKCICSSECGAAIEMEFNNYRRPIA